MLLAKAVKRFENEVDIVKFVRHTMLAKGMIKHLDQASIRESLRNRGRFIIHSGCSEGSGDSSDEIPVP